MSQRVGPPALACDGGLSGRWGGVRDEHEAPDGVPPLEADELLHGLTSHSDHTTNHADGEHAALLQGQCGQRGRYFDHSDGCRILLNSSCSL